MQQGIPMIRETIKAAQITAMKSSEKERLAAIRLILAKLKDRDIELRMGTAPADDDIIVVEVLSKMAKQRRESITMFEAGGRAELAAVEAAELAVIEGFMPARMSADDATAAIKAIIAEVGAAGPKDMGKVMAVLKSRHATDMDMSQASGLVKAALG
jgi:uncharacterized protein